MRKHKRSMHWLKIHKRIMEREWQSLPLSQRDQVVRDSNSEIAIWLRNWVERETERLFNDPNYHLNDPDSFRYSQYEDLRFPANVQLSLAA